MSLLKKVFLTIMLIALVAVGLLLYAGQQFARSMVKDAATEQQLQLARQTLFGVNRSLYDSNRHIADFTQNDTLLAAAARPADVRLRTQAAERLRDLNASDGGWDLLEIVDLQGMVVSSTDPSRIGATYPLDVPAYQKVYETAQAGTIAYSDGIRSLQTARPTMLFANALRTGGTQSGTVIGVLVGQVSWQTVLAPLQNDLTDTDFELFNSKGLELGDSEGADDEILTNARDEHSGISRALRGQEGSTVAEPVDGEEEVVMSYVAERGYRTYKGNGWVLVAQTPARKVFASIHEARTTTLLVFAGVIAVALTLVMLLLNYIIMRHVNTLMRVTQNIAAGDLTARAHIRSKDEFGQLGQAYNRMADKLQELYRNLEAKVQEKTAQLAERIEESEAARARDEAILSGMGEGLIALNDKSEVVLVNVRAADIFGIPRDKLFGHQLAKTLDTLRDGRDAPLADEYRPEVLAQATKEAVADEYTYHRYVTDGERMALNINATPIFNNGQFVGVVLVVRDMTKEKEVDRMKTEFISLASHQLRTPLSAIKWFGKMLVDGDAGALNDEQKEFAQNISDSTERMIELVNSLLNISRIESGRIVVDPKPTDLNELVSGIVNDLQGKISEKYQNLVVSVGEGLPKINIDTHLIGQVYLNLMTNAIKYTPKEGDIMVLISHNDTEVITQVTDNGFGIPVDQQEKVFQKFFRADNVAKFETDGTGLGLYLVKAIIESSGGRIWFKSEEGKGTTFWFTLPLSGMQAKEGDVVLDES